MRVANRFGRAVLLVDDKYFDIETRSDGRFCADAMEVLRRWSDVAKCVPELTTGIPDGQIQISELGPSVLSPRNVFAVGLN